jgi:hypothetical protein
MPTSPAQRRPARTESTPSIPPLVLDHVSSTSSEYCMSRRLGGLELSGDKVESFFEQ